MMAMVQMTQKLIFAQFYMMTFSSIKSDDQMTHNNLSIESISHLSQSQKLQTFPFRSNILHLSFITSPPLQLNNIANTDNLDNDQRNLIALHS